MLFREAIDGLREEGCPANQTFMCGNLCKPIPTCHNKNPKNTVPCTEPCQCNCDVQRGYVRNEINNRCIKKSDCPVLRCPPNEHEGCAPCPCWEPTCQDRNPECPNRGVCAPICIPKCRCNESYIRSNSTGHCIPIDQCPY
ncbi:inducible metalloproteinase inhibitor protein-like isoform X2 [Diabrotica undecimpunctata]|uniref:inducible metalloproteinase inhibitor protein-like isoform X2 n=1 Tax=Diabrotica undecimpunctata TaxID=50387 RepID=UPI003B6348BF